MVLGKGSLAIRIAEWFLESRDHDLVCVVPVVPEPTWAASLIAWAANRRVPLLESGDFRDVSAILGREWGVDLAFSITYDRIVTEEFIVRCARVLNIHNSPLPRYRGVSPINWALKNGEREHGVTIHEITPGIDDGPIVAQVRFSIYPAFDEVIDVYARALSYGWTLFEETMPVLDRIVAQPQEESEATYYSRASDVLLHERRSFTRAESLRRSPGDGLT